MASTTDDQFEAAALGLLLDLSGELVTYTALPAAPGGSNTDTANVQALVVHENASDDLAHQQREYRIPVATIADPKRSDFITDAAGLIWEIFEVDLPEGGVTPCHARIAQVDA